MLQERAQGTEAWEIKSSESEWGWRGSKGNHSPAAACADDRNGVVGHHGRWARCTGDWKLPKAVCLLQYYSACFWQVRCFQLAPAYRAADFLLFRRISTQNLHIANDAPFTVSMAARCEARGHAIVAHGACQLLIFILRRRKGDNYELNGLRVRH